MINKSNLLVFLFILIYCGWKATYCDDYFYYWNLSESLKNHGQLSVDVEPGNFQQVISPQVGISYLIYLLRIMFGSEWEVIMRLIIAITYFFTYYFLVNLFSKLQLSNPRLVSLLIIFNPYFINNLILIYNDNFSTLFCFCFILFYIESEIEFSRKDFLVLFIITLAAAFFRVNIYLLVFSSCLFELINRNWRNLLRLISILGICFLFNHWFISANNQENIKKTIDNQFVAGAAPFFLSLEKNVFFLTDGILPVKEAKRLSRSFSVFLTNAYYCLITILILIGGYVFIASKQSSKAKWFVVLSIFSHLIFFSLFYHHMNIPRYYFSILPLVYFLILYQFNCFTRKNTILILLLVSFVSADLFKNSSFVYPGAYYAFTLPVIDKFWDNVKLSQLRTDQTIFMSNQQFKLYYYCNVKSFPVSKLTEGNFVKEHPLFCWVGTMPFKAIAAGNFNEKIVFHSAQQYYFSEIRCMSSEVFLIERKQN
ncbi:MAG: hypothetical protein PHW04_02915 [Candidatus Wallbacteria bacterium]|nr:hypothetical protein [Candidatus Wallbacteria bacterium]